jgi:hypothetical protein
MKYKSLPILLLFPFMLALASCQPAVTLAPGATLQLASSTENDVEVIIALQRVGNEQFILSATFTPLEPGLHLYSKNIPRKGVDGIGRPTLFELPVDSKIVALDEAQENIPPQCPVNGAQELEIYPTGAVTLSIPILLPDGNEWFDEQVSVTYMACDDIGCHAPVENKLITIKIPANNIIQP